VVGCGETHSRVLASGAASNPDTACRETVYRQPTREFLASLTVMVETDPTESGSVSEVGAKFGKPGLSMPEATAFRRLLGERVTFGHIPSCRPAEVPP
jgi:hypothetical protein